MLVVVMTVMMASKTNPSFTSFLTHISTHASFQRLSEQEHLLFGELVLSAENDELTAFIDRIGLEKVLELVRHLSDTDAKTFAGYLSQHMGYLTHFAEWQHLQHWLKTRPGDEDDEGSEVDREENKRSSEADPDLHWVTFYRLLYDLRHGDYKDRLAVEERRTLDGLIEPSNKQTLSHYIDTVGYGPVFGLLNVLDPVHAHEVMILIELSLNGFPSH